MRIYLIEPIQEKLRMVPSFSIGLLYLASYLEKEGHEIKVSWINDRNELYHYLDVFNPHIVGITCSTPVVGQVLKIAEMIKEYKKDIFVITGGIHSTVRPVDLLESGNIDFCVIGEGEHTMYELCKAIEEGLSVADVKGIAYLKGGQLNYTEPRPLIQNLDDLPFPAYHLIPNYQWMLSNRKHRGLWVKRSESIITARGCPNRCIFCESHCIHGYKIRRRSPGNVIAEIKFLIEKYGIDHFTFLDDTFTYQYPKIEMPNGEGILWIDRFCDLVKKEGLKFTFICQSRANTLSDHVAKRLKEIGLKLFSFGFESGSDRDLVAIRKGITNNQIRDSMKIVHKYNLKSHASFLIGIPGQTMDDIKKTEKLVNEIKLDYADFFVITPFPGTELEKLAVENKWLDKKIPWENYEITDSITFRHENFNTEEILAIKKRLQNKYMFKNIWSSIGNVKGIMWGIGIVARNIYILPKSLKELFKTKGVHAFLMAFIVNDRKISHNKWIKSLTK